jgi:hypothetical protein
MLGVHHHQLYLQQHYDLHRHFCNLLHLSPHKWHLTSLTSCFLGYCALHLNYHSIFRIDFQVFFQLDNRNCFLQCHHNSKMKLTKILFFLYALVWVCLILDWISRPIFPLLFRFSRKSYEILIVIRPTLLHS